MQPQRKVNLEKLEAEGYWDLRETQQGVIGLMRLFTTIGIAVGLDPWGYKYRYCYRTLGEAEGALNDWALVGYVGEPVGYIVRKGEGGDKRGVGHE